MYRSPTWDSHWDTVSFDVFDTLITRPWYSPSDQFRAVGIELRRGGLFGGTRDEWLALRMDCETEARAAEGVEEVSLQDIYAVIARRLGWDTGRAAQAMAIEHARERRDIRPIIPIRQLFNELSATRNVIAVSDTYFSQEEVHSFLDQCGFRMPLANVYSSSSLGATKHSGRLFAEVLRSRGLLSDQLTHIGDNPWTDGRSPARLKIKSFVCPDHLPNRYEEELAKPHGYDPFICSALAGAARAARLARSFNKEHERELWAVGASVAGPLLLAYVLWVLDRARKQGIERLYFLARDGEISLHIARLVCTWMQWDIDCRYLYTSRQSFSLPSITSVDAAATAWILKWPRISTVRSILSRVALVPEEISDQLVAAGYPPASWDHLLSETDVPKLGTLLRSDGVSNKILAHAADRRAILIKYLEQEGLLDGRRWALCDVGWQGSIQNALSALLAHVPRAPKQMKGFYFGLDEQNLLVPRTDAEAFLGSDISGLVWMIEAFCASEDGSVDRFEEADGAVVPHFRSQRDEHHTEWRASIQREAILEFVRELTQTLDSKDVEAGVVTSAAAAKALSALDLFRRTPGFAEAGAYGRLQSSAVPTHNAMLEGAPDLPLPRLLAWLFLRERSGVPWISWPQASIQRSTQSRILRAALSLTFETRNLIDRLRKEK